MKNTKPTPPSDFTTCNFYNRFKLVVANTNKLREEVYKIRYKVYCQELNYDSKDCRDGMEQDIYDWRSIHCLLLHRSSQIYAGCVRLVLPNLNQTEVNLPFERVYGRSSQNVKLRLPSHSFGEVSRLAIASKFRQRSGEVQIQGISDEQRKALENDQRYFPLIALGLYLAATSLCQEAGLDGAVTLMESRLMCHLRRFGINPCQVGELVEVHGQRGLFHLSLSGVLSSMNASTYQLFQLLRSEVKKSLFHWNPSLLYYRTAKQYDPGSIIQKQPFLGHKTDER